MTPFKLESGEIINFDAIAKFSIKEFGLVGEESHQVTIQGQLSTGEWVTLRDDYEDTKTAELELMALCNNIERKKFAVTPQQDRPKGQGRLSQRLILPGEQN